MARSVGHSRVPGSNGAETTSKEERQMIAEPCPDGQQPCVVQQKQEGVSALRLKAIGGNLTTEQLRTIVAVADKYGNGDAAGRNRTLRRDCPVRRPVTTDRND